VIRPLRTVRLVDGPAAGREAQARDAWVAVALLDGELVVYDPDGDVQAAWAALDRVARAWITYHQGSDAEHPELYYYVDGPPRLEADNRTTPTAWQRMLGSFAPGVDAADQVVPPGGPVEG